MNTATTLLLTIALVLGVTAPARAETGYEVMEETIRATELVAEGKFGQAQRHLEQRIDDVPVGCEAVVGMTYTLTVMANHAHGYSAATFAALEWLDQLADDHATEYTSECVTA